MPRFTLTPTLRTALETVIAEEFAKSNNPVALTVTALTLETSELRAALMPRVVALMDKLTTQLASIDANTATTKDRLTAEKLALQSLDDLLNS